MSKHLFFKSIDLEDDTVIILEYILGKTSGEYSIQFTETSTANAHVSAGTGVIYETQDLLEAFLVAIEKRRTAYDLLNQDEMRYDDVKNSTTTWVDAIDAIKTAHPKPVA
jgi:hypothetical protein